MESRQQVMYQAEYDIQKLLEMNNPPFAFIDTKLAELQSFVEEIGAANLNLKIEWIQQVETLKDRYEATKIGINEHELIEMHFALQTLMAESRPKIEEIHFKMTEFRGMLSKIPIDSKMFIKWNALSGILYNDYQLLTKKRTIIDSAVLKAIVCAIEQMNICDMPPASTQTPQPLMDIVSSSDNKPEGTYPPLQTQQQSNDLTAALAEQQSSNTGPAPTSAARVRQQQSVDWGAPTSEVHSQQSDPSSPTVTSFDTAPVSQHKPPADCATASVQQQSTDWSTTPAFVVQNQSNGCYAPSLALASQNKPSDDLGSLLFSADQIQQKPSGRIDPDPVPSLVTSVQQPNDWSAPPVSAAQVKSHSNDLAAVSSKSSQPRWDAPPRCKPNTVGLGFDQYKDRNQANASQGSHNDFIRHPQCQPPRPHVVVDDMGIDWTSPFEENETSSTPQGLPQSEEMKENQCQTSTDMDTSAPDEQTVKTSELEQLAADIICCLDERPLLMGKLETKIQQFLVLAMNSSADEQQAWNDQVGTIIDRYNSALEEEGQGPTKAGRTEESPQLGGQNTKTIQCQPQVTDATAARLLYDLAKCEAEARYLQATDSTSIRLEMLIRQIRRHIEQLPIHDQNGEALRQHWEEKLNDLNTAHMATWQELRNVNLDGLVHQLSEKLFEVEQAIADDTNIKSQWLTEKLTALSDLLAAIPPEHAALHEQWHGKVTQLKTRCAQLLDCVTSSSAEPTNAAYRSVRARAMLKIAFDKLYIIRAPRDLNRLKPLLEMTAKAHLATSAELHGDILHLALQRMSSSLVEQFKAQSDGSLPHLLSFLCILIRQQSEPGDDKANFCLKCTVFGHTRDACTQTACRINLATLLN